MIGPRHRRFLVVIGVLSFFGAGCSAADESVLADGSGLGAVETADAASASASRTALVGRDGGAGPEVVSAEDRAAAAGGSDGSGSDGSGDSTATNRADGGAAGRTAGSGVTGPDGPSGGGTPSVTTATTTPYPAITEEIVPANGGVRALRTAGGVVMAVTGQTSAGYVVETPCGGITQLASGEPITEAQVVLDPGHGGDEPGAMGVVGPSEAALNLSVAERTAAVLTERSISAVLTRNADYRIPIRRRAALADAIGPQAFVSIHHNTPASRPSPVPGTEVYVQSTSGQSLRLGGLLHQEVFNTLADFDVEWTSRNDAGVLIVLDDDNEDAYGIARYPATTSALIEMAYLGNEKEAVLLATAEYVEAAAVALADGIQRFLTTDEYGTDVVEAPRVFNPSGATGGSGGCVDPPLE